MKSNRKLSIAVLLALVLVALFALWKRNKELSIDSTPPVDSVPAADGEPSQPPV